MRAQALRPGGALAQAWPTTYATVCGFLLSAVFGIPVAMLIAWWWNRGEESGRQGFRFKVPGFILGFLVVAALFIAR